jgi:hypothetical protein
MVLFSFDEPTVSPSVASKVPWRVSSFELRGQMRHLPEAYSLQKAITEPISTLSCYLVKP